MLGPKQRWWSERLEADHANLRTAHAWLVDYEGGNLATLGSDAPASVVRWVDEVGARVCARDTAVCATD